MKQFFKTMFASVFGALIAMGIFLMTSIAFLAGVVASSSSSSTYKPAKNTVFKLSLKGTLTEQSNDNPLAGLLSSSDEQVALPDLIHAIQKAKQNPDVSGREGHLFGRFGTLGWVCFLLRTTSGFGGFQIRREVHSLVRRRLFARWILLGECVRFTFCQSARHGRIGWSSFARDFP